MVVTKIQELSDNEQEDVDHVIYSAAAEVYCLGAPDLAVPMHVLACTGGASIENCVFVCIGACIGLY